MFGIEHLTGTAQAVAVVGLVVAEALVLNAGYGVLARVTSPAIAGVLAEA